MMIIIFMLIITIIPEQYTKPFGPLCESISEFSPCTMETCALVPIYTLSEVRVMSDTGEFSKTFDGIIVVGLGMPYTTWRKSGVHMTRLHE